MVEKKDFRAELIQTAKEVSRPGFGILAADESTGTIGQRFQKINVENVEENRRAYRELLFTTPHLEDYISGVLMFEETLDQNSADGKNLVEVLREKKIIAGIKVDKGIVPIGGALPGETSTTGLDGLAERCKKYYEKGCRFAKWRAVLRIGNGCPSDLSIDANAHGLARYGAIC